MKNIKTIVLFLIAFNSLYGAEWEFLKELHKKIDPKIPLTDFYTPKSESEVFVKQSFEGSADPYITNTKWPVLKDLDFSYKFMYHVPDGAVCRETPMLRHKFHINGDKGHMFYRGYHYTGLAGIGSKMIPPKEDIWYGVRIAVKGKVAKAKFWEIEKGEPVRWSIEGLYEEEPKAGRVAFTYRAWKAQKGTEITFKDIKVMPFNPESFEYLEEETRPVRTTGEPEGRKLVGYPWEYYSAKDCKWPNHKYTRIEAWDTVQDKISVPEGWEKPTIVDGKLVIQVPANDAPDKNQVVWLSKIIKMTNRTKFEVEFSDGVVPLIWYQNRNRKTKEWTEVPGVMDPTAQPNLMAVIVDDTKRFSSYGTNHLLKDVSVYRYMFRFRNGASIYYGSVDEVCDVLEPGTPSVPWDGKPRIGFSAKGKKGTLTITPISYEK